MHITRAVDTVNEIKKKTIFKNIKSHFINLKNKKVAIWGLAFKPKTDDMREAPSIVTINLILNEGVKVYVYNQEAMDNAKKIFKDKIAYGKTPYDCLVGVDALTIITEWNEFRNPDFKRIGKLMRNRVIFDGRNIYNLYKLREFGFEYYGIWRS